jgi:hypothetical protein
MQALKVQVKNGRLDELTPEERVELHASLDRALDDSEGGAAWTPANT